MTAYAVERPDGQWSVMLVNRDQSNDHAVKIAFEATAEVAVASSPDKSTASPSAPNEYQWHQEGVAGHAGPGRPALEAQRCREARKCSISSRKPR